MQQLKHIIFQDLLNEPRNNSKFIKIFPSTNIYIYKFTTDGLSTFPNLIFTLYS